MDDQQYSMSLNADDEPLYQPGSSSSVPDKFLSSRQSRNDASQWAVASGVAQVIDIAPRGDALVEFAFHSSPAHETAASTLRFRVLSGMLSSSSPVFAEMFAGPDAMRSKRRDGVVLGSGAATSAAEATSGGEGPTASPLSVASTTATDMVCYGTSRRHTCRDGTSLPVYCISFLCPPQDNGGSDEDDDDHDGDVSSHRAALSILLHAAHWHTTSIPHDIAYPTLIALAQAALRLRCTAPLALAVEHRWLPQWMHKAQEDMPDGLLLVGYAFGYAGWFERMTKTAVLNIGSAEELRRRPWPEEVRTAVWQVREAKVEQVIEACRELLADYLRPPQQRTEAAAMAAMAAAAGRERQGEKSHQQDKSRSHENETRPGRPMVREDRRSSILSSFSMATSISPPPPQPPAMPPLPLSPLPSTVSATTRASDSLNLTSTTRCPRGSHLCDATNLGWLLLAFNQLGLLHRMAVPGVPAAAPLAPSTQPASLDRSFAKLVDGLRSICSPPNPIHPSTGRSFSPCDPVPVLRAAINDVYNSVEGLCLWEVDPRWTPSPDSARLRRHARRKVTARRAVKGRSLSETNVEEVLVGDMEGLSLTAQSAVAAVAVEDVAAQPAESVWAVSETETEMDTEAETALDDGASVVYDARRIPRIVTPTHSEGEAGVESHAVLMSDNEVQEILWGPDASSPPSFNRPHSVERRPNNGRSKTDGGLYVFQDNTPPPASVEPPHDEDTGSNAPTMVDPEPGGPTPKYRPGDVFGCPTAKVLPVAEDKLLRVDHERRMGLAAS